jgi:hypothetical protein
MALNVARAVAGGKCHDDAVDRRRREPGDGENHNGHQDRGQSWIQSL